MPYASVKQDRYIHAKAAEGIPWAKKFVADSHGTHVGAKVKRRRRKRHARR